jgi:hypothetical protein
MGDVWHLAMGILLAEALILVAVVVAVATVFGVLRILRWFMRLGARMVVYRDQQEARDA